MAVKTAISLETVRTLCQGEQTGEIRSIDPIGRGNTQTNYRVHAQKGKFVFRLYENRPAEAVAFEMEVLAMLETKGFACPYPAGPAGEWRGKPFALFRFVEGAHAQDWSDERRMDTARTAARLSLCTVGFRPQHTAARMNYGKPFCEKMARELAEKHAKPEKLAWYLQQIARLELPPEMPMGVCHADWDISNMLFDGERVTALLDFDDANYTCLAYDLASMLDPVVPGFRWDTWQNYAPDAQVIDLQAARMLVQAYEQVRPLQDVEEEHLYDLLRLAILIDCLWFFGRGDGDFFEKRKLDALERIGRENFRRAVFG